MDPIKKDLILKFTNKLSFINEINEIYATAKITPGMAYPEIENVVRV